jgi:hypothetical protein
MRNGRIGVEDKIKMSEITGIQEIIKFDLVFVINIIDLSNWNFYFYTPSN